MKNKLGQGHWRFGKLLDVAISENRDDEEDLSRMRVSGLGYLKVVDAVKDILDIEPAKKRKFPKRTMITFGIGHGVHWWIQNQVANANKNLFAKWKCVKCGTEEVGIDVSSCKECGVNGREYFKYGEVYLSYKNKESRVSFGGHPDVIKVVNINTPYHAFVTDIKTSNDVMFNRFKSFGPSEEYLVQVMVYMFLIKHNIKKYPALFGVENIHGRVFYLNKNDSSTYEVGVKINDKVIDRCLLMYDFYERCLREKKVVEGFDLEDLNKTVIEHVGRESFDDYWFPV